MKNKSKQQIEDNKELIQLIQLIHSTQTQTQTQFNSIQHQNIKLAVLV